MQGVPVTPTSQPISVDYDVISRTLYWIQQGQDSVQIWSSDLNYNYPTLIFDGTNGECQETLDNSMQQR